MIPLEEIIAFLHRLEALGWLAQVVGLALLLAGYALLLFIARLIGKHNIAFLKDDNTNLKKQVAESDAKRQKILYKESKLKAAIESLQAQRSEERLACAAKKREHGDEEGAIELYEEIFTTFGPDLARCCEALAAGGDEPDAERYRTLVARLAGMGTQR